MIFCVEVEIGHLDPINVAYSGMIATSTQIIELKAVFAAHSSPQIPLQLLQGLEIYAINDNL